jgi:hypothetical protein
MKYDDFLAELDSIFISSSRVLADLPIQIRDDEEARSCDQLHSYLKSAIEALEFLDQRAIDRSDAYHSKRTAAQIIAEN